MRKGLLGLSFAALLGFPIVAGASDARDIKVAK
jgi:hypothetical protein